nr:hypothetical protein [Nitrosomonas nitrosa]
MPIPRRLERCGPLVVEDTDDHYRVASDRTVKVTLRGLRGRGANRLGVATSGAGGERARSFIGVAHCGCDAAQT